MSVTKEVEAVENKWIEYQEEKPEEARALWYFFYYTGVNAGEYYGDWQFGGAQGFLTCDVTHWQYREEGQERPDPPLKEEPIPYELEEGSEENDVAASQLLINTTY